MLLELIALVAAQVQLTCQFAMEAKCYGLNTGVGVKAL